MAWTPITKPGAQNWSNVNPMGLEQYDQATVSYDDPTVFYDGLNPNMWTDVAKPSLSLGNLQWQDANISWDEALSPWSSSGWVSVDKPS